MEACEQVNDRETNIYVAPLQNRFTPGYRSWTTTAQECTREFSSCKICPLKEFGYEWCGMPNAIKSLIRDNVTRRSHTTDHGTKSSRVVKSGKLF